MSTSNGDVKRRQPYSSSADASQTVLDTAKSLESTVEDAWRQLVGWDDLEPWRRDNAFILTGYRPDSNSYRRSFASLTHLHNETVNIWSHLIGAVLFLCIGTFLYRQVSTRYAAATDSDLLVFACFFAGAVVCLGMSATYHALSNHSPEVSRWGNKLDYSGIVFLIVGSYVPALYYGFFCLPGLMTVYLSVVRCCSVHRDAPKGIYSILTGPRLYSSAWAAAWSPGLSTFGLPSGAHFALSCLSPLASLASSPSSTDCLYMVIGRSRTR